MRLRCGGPRETEDRAPGEKVKTERERILEKKKKKRKIDRRKEPRENTRRNARVAATQQSRTSHRRLFDNPYSATRAGRMKKIKIKEEKNYK